MAASVVEQEITERYAAYNGDACEVLGGLPAESIHASIYSPPFCGLYHYSSSERDLSNARSYEEFFEHYEYVVREIHRLLMPGRIAAVHCMDVPRDGANAGAGLMDFPGDIIRLHERLGFRYACRYHIWKEPMEVRNRTMARGLAHRQIVEDSSLCDVASADYLLMFRKEGKNPVPVAHPQGLLSYAGSREMPAENYKYKGWKGKQTQNKYSHWIWRQYASAFWDDVRLGRVLPSGEAKEHEDERHMHPLQLDVIERAVVLWTNPGETVLTPFMGVGSEVAGALLNGRKAVGIELKPSYYRHALNNIRATVAQTPEQADLFAGTAPFGEELAALMDAPPARPLTVEVAPPPDPKKPRQRKPRAKADAAPPEPAAESPETVPCPSCRGEGIVRSAGGYVMHSCGACKGTGRVPPGTMPKRMCKVCGTCDPLALPELPDLCRLCKHATDRGITIMATDKVRAVFRLYTFDDVNHPRGELNAVAIGRAGRGLMGDWQDRATGEILRPSRAAVEEVVSLKAGRALRVEGVLDLPDGSLAIGFVAGVEAQTVPAGELFPAPLAHEGGL